MERKNVVLTKIKEATAHKLFFRVVSYRLSTRGGVGQYLVSKPVLTENKIWNRKFNESYGC